MAREFVLPDLGEGITEAQVVRLLVQEGDQVEEDQGLLEVETDKAAVEIPSPFAGTIAKIHVETGQVINVGNVIVTFGNGQEVVDSTPGEKEQPAEKPGPAKEEAEKPAPASTQAQAPAPTTAPTEPKSQTAPPTKTTVPASPAVRSRARELGIDLEQVRGSGPGGRVTHEDLDQHQRRPAGGHDMAPAAAQTSPVEQPVRKLAPSAELPEGEDGADKWGPVRSVPLNQIRKTIATKMSRSVYTIPHVTACDEADVTELERMRRALNEETGGDPKLTTMAFVIRSACLALRVYPIMNASFDAEASRIVYRRYCNIGIAVDSQRGLIVPVIRNVDQLSLLGIAAELRSIAERIRSNRFEIDDLRGGTFTVTNYGALGGIFGTPIINYPEVAILGVGRMRQLAVMRDGVPQPALMLPLSLSFDHRATDGATAARFTNELMSYLQTPARFLLH